MRHPFSSAFSSSLALLITLIAWAAPALAYPSPRGATVNDFADVLSPAQEERLHRRLEALHASDGVEATVVTIRSFADYETGDPTFEAFATGLFDAWGVGDARRGGGVMLLFGLEDRAVRIELGEGWEALEESRVERIVDDVMLPRFRDGDLSGGLVAGSEALVSTLSSTAPSSTALGPPPGPLPAEAPPGAAPSPPTRLAAADPSPPTRSRADKDWLGPAAGVGGVLLLLGALLGPWIAFHRRPGKCSECDGRLRLLDDTAEDAHLLRGQLVEEEIGSRDYRVYECPACRSVSFRSRSRIFSLWKTCSSCEFRTLRTDTETLRRPTTLSTGRERQTDRCAHCDHTEVRVVTLPRIEEADDPPLHSGSRSGRSSGGASSSWSVSSGGSSGSSSSDRSFSGGSSSGRGASGRW